METQNLPIKIRPATDEDIPFIMSSWLKCYRDCGPIAANVANTIYFSQHHKLIQNIIKRSKILIACNQEDPTQIYGYAAAEEIEGHFALHFVYTKHNFRRMGIGSVLYNSFERKEGRVGVFTHWTRIGHRLHQKYNLIYHPYVIILGYSDK